MILSRADFFKELSVALESATSERPLSVACIDIDGLYSLNQTFGHDVGDVAIAWLRELTVKHFGSWCVLGTLGAAEPCLFSASPTSEVIAAAERFRHEVGSYVQVVPPRGGFTVTVGVHQVTDRTSHTLAIEPAFQACKRGKKSLGGNTVVVS